MADTVSFNVWLQKPDGARQPIRGKCSIGRDPTNQFALNDQKVSRRHALIHVQDKTELWLVDLGSRNGTYLNGRRVNQPIRLKNGDRIDIGDTAFLFGQTAAVGTVTDATIGDVTAPDLKVLHCWLLLADVISSTQLSQRLSTVRATSVIGKWLDSSRQIVEDCGGNINKFLGDGFFAYWHDLNKDGVLRALEKFKALQKKDDLQFRLVLHYGRVRTGGSGSMGEESLFGSDVNFIFRMERCASGLGEARLMSEPASKQLEGNLTTTLVGSHEVDSFDGKFNFYSF